MKLYSLPLSPYSARVRGALYAKDLQAEIVPPPDGWSSSDAFRAVNPLGRIPVLVLDDGTSICESGVIVEYLDDAHPEPPLRPRTAVDRARARLVTQVGETYVMSAMMPLFFLFDANEKDKQAIDAQLAKLDDALGRLDPMLQHGRYAVGDDRGIADVWLTPMRFSLDGLMSFAGLKGLLDKHPRVAGYADVAQKDRVLSRVWAEMTEGLKAFIERRAADAKAKAKAKAS
jgi:glutathione S-transferase